jgi:hypothetical protein
MLDIENLKPSIVLQAMITGLKKSKDDPNFIVEMSAFGYVKNKLCYGCCATVALAEMFGQGKSASELMLSYDLKVRSEKLYSYLSDHVYANLSSVIELEPSRVQGSLPINLQRLEISVEYARIGHVSSLIEILTGELNESFDDRWNLGNGNWEEKLPIVEATIAEMIAAGY